MKRFDVRFGISFWKKNKQNGQRSVGSGHFSPCLVPESHERRWSQREPRIAQAAYEAEEGTPVGMLHPGEFLSFSERFSEENARKTSMRVTFKLPLLGHSSKSGIHYHYHLQTLPGACGSIPCSRWLSQRSSAAAQGVSAVRMPCWTRHISYQIWFAGKDSWFRMAAISQNGIKPLKYPKWKSKVLYKARHPSKKTEKYQI